MSFKIIKQDETDGLNMNISIHTYQPQQFYPPHHDKRSRISVILKGQLRETVGNNEENADVMSVVIKPNSIRHKNEFGPLGASMLSITWEEDTPPDFIKELDILSKWKWLHGTKLAASTIEFLADLKYYKDNQYAKASIIEFVASLTTSELENSFSDPPSWLKQIKEQLNDEYNTPILVQHIANEVGIHPVYLARIFKKTLRLFYQDLFAFDQIIEINQHNRLYQR